MLGSTKSTVRGHVENLRITTITGAPRVVTVVFWLIFIPLLLIGLAAGVELACRVSFRILSWRWVFQEDPNHPPNVFVRHPYLVAVGATGRQPTGVVHNSLDFRSKEISTPKKPGVKRIITLGGSTTYGTFVPDGATWSEVLQKELGAGYEVMNWGIPGYTTVENLTETALLLSDAQPDIAIYYEGWNDARVQHIKDLQGDYSNFHPRSLYITMGFGPAFNPEKSATAFFIKQRLFSNPQADPLGQFHIEPSATALTAEVDARPIQLYQRNLRSIAAIDRSMKIQPIFVPQVMNYSQLTSNEPYGWLPYVRDRDLRSVIQAYNEAMGKVATEIDVPFVETVLHEDFPNREFGDNGHFNEDGSAHFARRVRRVLAQFIKTTAAAQ